MLRSDVLTLFLKSTDLMFYLPNLPGQDLQGKQPFLNPPPSGAGVTGDLLLLMPGFVFPYTTCVPPPHIQVCRVQYLLKAGGIQCFQHLQCFAFLQTAEDGSEIYT